MDATQYARWFRDSTPYISAHRGKTFVVMLGGDALAADNLTNTVHDLALLKVLGVKLVIVAGTAPDGPERPDADAIGSLVTEAGAVRARLEAMFSTGLPSSPLRNSRITLVSGNFVTARPVGVVDGVDHLHAGQPRRIDARAVRVLLENDSIVLLPSVAASTTGEMYGMRCEQLAEATAVALGADKLIVYDSARRIEDKSDVTPNELLALLDAAALEPATRDRVTSLMRACRAGVPRCHLISFADDGAILGELFTAEGVGTQVSEEDYRLIRRATIDDVPGIIDLIRPLEADGTLVRRPRDRLEAEIDRFLVAELDGILIGCCAVYPHGEQSCELGCLATHPQHRHAVNGESLGRLLLKRAESEARQIGARTIFVLTTRAHDWFAENAFVLVDIGALPASKRSLYNYQRNSKVMIKSMEQSGP